LLIHPTANEGATSTTYGSTNNCSTSSAVFAANHAAQYTTYYGTTTGTQQATLNGLAHGLLCSGGLRLGEIAAQQQQSQQQSEIRTKGFHEEKFKCVGVMKAFELTLQLRGANIN
jgi:hypothetical protein